MWLHWLGPQTFCRFFLYITVQSACFYQVKGHPTPVHKSTTTFKVNATNDTTHFFPNDDEHFRITRMAVNAIGAVLNTLLIIAIIVDPLKVLRKGAWVSILNLAAADFISCVSSFLEVGLIFEFEVFHSATLKAIRFLLFFGESASFMFLTLLTAETYVVTRYPIRGRILLTFKKNAIFCMVVWLLAIPLGLSNIAYHFTTSLSRVMKIYIVKIAVLEFAVVIQVILKTMIIYQIMKSGRSIEQHNSRHKEVAKTVVMLNVILIITAFPYFVAKQLEFLVKLSHIGGNRLVWKFSNYYHPIAAINYVANPILYAFRLPDYRRTLVSPFKRCASANLFTSQCLSCKSAEDVSFSPPQRSSTTTL